jgi:hypothetical protein
MTKQQVKTKGKTNLSKIEKLSFGASNKNVIG